MTKQTMTPKRKGDELPGVLAESESSTAIDETAKENGTAAKPAVSQHAEASPDAGEDAPGAAVVSKPYAVPAELLEPAPKAYLVSQEAINYEHEMMQKYLGEDLEAVCEFAGISADSVIVHSASGDLPTRLEASRIWRRRRFFAERQAHRPISDWFDTLDPDRAHAVTSGETLLREIDRAAYAHQKIMEQKKDEAHADLKAAIAKGINSAVEDANPEANHPQFPAFLVMQDDGEVKLYRSDANAKAAHMGRCKRFWIMPVNTTAIREYHGDA